MKQIIALFAGIDISKSTLDVALSDGRQVMTFSNSPAGCQKLIRYLQKNKVCRVLFEATGIYDRELEENLVKSSIEASKLNSGRSRQLASCLGYSAKTDNIDARMLAHAACLNIVIPPCRIRTSHEKALEELVKERHNLIAARTAVKNQMQALRLPETLKRSQKRLEIINLQIQEIDDQIEDVRQDDEELNRRFKILTSIKGIGTVAANTLLALMPETGTLENKQIASLAGLAPYARQSGSWVGKSHISKGRAKLRSALYMPAIVAIRFNPDMKRVHENLLKRGKPFKLAIVAVMRKLLILANTLIKQNRMWNKNYAFET